MHLVLADDNPKQGRFSLVPVDDPPAEKPGLRLVPVDETPQNPQTPDELYRAANALLGPVPRGVDLNKPETWPKRPLSSFDVRDHHPAPEPTPEPQLPPGIYEENGVYMRERPGRRPVPVGEKGLEEPMYTPFDLAFDLATGGALGLIRTPAKAGAKALAKAMGKHMAGEGAWGGLAGGTMEAVNQATDNKLGALAAGLGSPLAARLALTGGRKLLAKGMEKAADKAADKVVKSSWGLADRIPKLDGTELAGHLQGTFGTRAEAIGPDVHGTLLSHEAKTALEMKRIAAEMGRHTLNQKLVNALTGKAAGLFMSPEAGLILGQRARDFAAKVSPKLAARMGLTPDELRLGAKLVEAMPAPDVNGVLRFGVKVKGKDGAKDWAHGLDPQAAQDLFLEQRPELQKLVLAYIAPLGGWRNAPRLAEQGYDAGRVALDDIAERYGLDLNHLANELKSQGKGKWIGAAEAARVPREQAELATDYLRRKAAGLVREARPPRDLTGADPMELQDALGKLYQKAVGTPGGVAPVKESIAYKHVGPDEAERLRQVRGIEADGYVHTVDVYSIRHANKHHGERGVEAKRGQLPVTEDDVKRIPEIVSNPDSIDSAREFNNQGKEIVKYRKRFNGETVFVEEVRTGRNELSAVTLYKMKTATAPRATDPRGPGVAQTPEAFRSSPNNIASLPGSDNLKARLKGRAVKGAGNGVMDMDIDPPDAGMSADLAALGRDELHSQLVKAGILEPEQYAQGYLARYGTASEPPPSVAVDAPDLRLGKVYEPMAQRRGAWFNPERRLDETITLQRQVAQDSVRHRQLLRKLVPMILEEVPKDAKLDDSLMRSREVFDPAAGRMVWRKEAMVEVYVPPDEAEALGVKEGRYLIPKALDEHFGVLMGRKKSGEYHTPLQKFNDAVRSLATYWTLNVLSAPGTIATNAIGGAAQYSSKWFEDLFRGDLRQLKNTTMAPFMALGSKYRQAVPKEAFGEGANLWRGMDEGGGLFMKDAHKRLREGEKVSLGTKAAMTGDAALHGALKAHLAPFSTVDDYWKRATFIAEARTNAERHVDELIKAGKADPAERGQLVFNHMASTLSERPEEFAETMLGPVDRFAYLYQNIPSWMQKLRHNPYFRLLGMPFVVYPYKYGRMVGSQLNAFNPLSKMPMKERLARAGGLLGSAGAPALGTAAYLKATGQESQVEKQRERFKEEQPGKQWPGTRLGGRGYVGTTDDGKERYFRWVKYGPWGLPSMAQGTEDLYRHGSSEDLKALFDDFKSRGPGLDLLASYFEMDPRFGPKDTASQAAEFAKGFVPFHRWQDYLAKEADKDAQGRMRKRRPRGPMEQIMEIIPGQRQKLRQPPDRVTGEPATLDTGQERLKFLTGLNFRDVDPAREEAALAKFNLKQGKDWAKKEELADLFGSRYPQLDKQKLMDAMDRILIAGQDAFANVERGVKFKVYKKARQKAAGGLDPWNLGQQEALRDLNRKLAGFAIKGMTGMPNNELARKKIRIIGANNWIVDHWEELLR